MSTQGTDWIPTTHVIGMAETITHTRTTPEGYSQLLGASGVVYHRPPFGGGGYVPLVDGRAVLPDGSVARPDPRITRIAEQIIAERKDQIENVQDITWYVDEYAEYNALTEHEHYAVTLVMRDMLSL